MEEKPKNPEENLPNSVENPSNSEQNENPAEILKRIEEINIKDESPLHEEVKDDPEEAKKSQLIKEILTLQDEFNALSKQSEDLTVENTLLKEENEVFAQYIDNLMERINKINPDILSQFNKNH